MQVKFVIKKILLALLVLLLFGCVSTYRLNHMLNPPPKEISDCGLDTVSNFASSNFYQYACVASTALAEQNPRLCDYAPDYETTGGSGGFFGGLASSSTGKYGVEKCKNDLSGSFSWDILLDQQHPQVMKSLQIMKDNGFDFDVLYPYRNVRTPLLIAAAEKWDIPAQERIVILQFLIDNGAYLGVRDEFGNNVFQRVSTMAVNDGEGAPKVIKFLIAQGLSPDSKDAHGKTALMNAASGLCDDAEVTVLLGYGANPNVVSSEGSTALIYASKSDWPEYCSVSIKSLVNKGADVRIADANGMTALDYVNKWDPFYKSFKAEISRLLKEKGAVEKST